MSRIAVDDSQRHCELFACIALPFSILPNLFITLLCLFNLSLSVLTIRNNTDPNNVPKLSKHSLNLD